VVVTSGVEVTIDVVVVHEEHGDAGVTRDVWPAWTVVVGADDAPVTVTVVDSTQGG